MLVNLARFPEIQEKCYKALSDVSFRCDSLNDCPYFLAAVWESYRYSTSIYRSLIHSVTQDTKINGMTFKKDDLMAARKLFKYFFVFKKSDKSASLPNCEYLHP